MPFGTNIRTVDDSNNHDSIDADGYDSDGEIGPFFDAVLDELNIFDGAFFQND